jgi:hypothetical protein
MVDGAYVADAQGSRIVVGVDRHPDKGRLTHTTSTRVHASVCGSCGFVEFYANRPAEIFDAYQGVGQTPAATLP